jgi:hypothetical protein
MSQSKIELRYSPICCVPKTCYMSVFQQSGKMSCVHPSVFILFLARNPECAYSLSTISVWIPTVHLSTDLCTGNILYIRLITRTLSVRRRLVNAHLPQIAHWHDDPSVPFGGQSRWRDTFCMTFHPSHTSKMTCLGLSTIIHTLVRYHYISCGLPHNKRLRVSLSPVNLI